MKGKADISLRVSDIFDTQRFAIELDFDDNESGFHIYDDAIYISLYVFECFYF